MKRILFAAFIFSVAGWFVGDAQAFDDVVRCRVTMAAPVARVPAVHVPSTATVIQTHQAQYYPTQQYYPAQQRTYVPRASSNYRYSSPRVQSNWRGREVDWSRVESRADDVMSAIWSIF